MPPEKSRDCDDKSEYKTWTRKKLRRATTTQLSASRTIPIVKNGCDAQPWRSLDTTLAKLRNVINRTVRKAPYIST
jgi:hypothetical protein